MKTNLKIVFSDEETIKIHDFIEFFEYFYILYLKFTNEYKTEKEFKEILENNFSNVKLTKSDINQYKGKVTNLEICELSKHSPLEIVLNGDYLPLLSTICFLMPKKLKISYKDIKFKIEIGSSFTEIVKSIKKRNLKEI